MRKTTLLLAALVLLVWPASGGFAGIDADAPVPHFSNLQLVVMEAPGCTYCDIFRRDVLPSYEASQQAKDMPVRFIDVNDLTKTQIELQSQIDILPTFVIAIPNRHDDHINARAPNGARRTAIKSSQENVVLMRLYAP